MQTKTYNWGILGAGKIAKKFSEDLLSVPGANLYAVASRSLNKAEEFAENLNIAVSYGSYLELVEDEKVDIVYIATPHTFHFEHSLLCLQHKKAVLCEKPLGINLDQVETMITEARKEKVFLMEALWTQFLPHFNYVLDLVESKKYGELVGLEADFGFNAPFDPEKRIYNKKLGGGSLMDVGIYPVFLALSLLGKPREIKANAKIGKTGVDENCTIEFSYSNGVKAHLYSAIDETTPTMATLKFEEAEVVLNTRFHEPSSITIQLDGNEETIEFPVTTHGYNFEATHLQTMLAEGKKESTKMTFAKSLDLIELLDAIRKEIGLVYQ
ncbi:putative dehydrogenase [Gillisia sp. Hel_I_86]|uniref:Gfo/Idh/MocA family protein n=1 Tax=Gillisia sp. Hel_I_86 TaxID=1249981 RepID=UPI00119C0279|nr:Gfo/Idh/MocA family oxidoreductase [Gillisia sp. Hel_I_86]TVZ27762.1 putative dehydrogenase [Gillisia sp. Hel_I_86]